MTNPSPVRRSSGFFARMVLACLCITLFAGIVSHAQEAPSESPVLLFGIGVHIEPFGAQVSSIALEAGAAVRTLDPRQMNYNQQPDFQRHVDDLLNLAATVEEHGGVLTIQAQTPFTTSCVRFNNTVLADLADRGHEIGLHFHENVHLGEDEENLPPEVWAAVMEEELDWIRRAGVESPLKYWSGGNLYPLLLQAAADAGLSLNSDWKNPATQSTPPALIDIHPWRPSGGIDGENLTAFATHDPSGRVIFLPGGEIDPVEFAHKNTIRETEGLEGWLDVLEDALRVSLASARSDRVNVVHFTVHPGEFVGDPDHPYALLHDFLDDVVDPLVETGRIRWATFSEMGEAFEAWEAAHPQVDPRS